MKCTLRCAVQVERLTKRLEMVSAHDSDQTALVARLEAEAAQVDAPSFLPGLA